MRVCVYYIIIILHTLPSCGWVLEPTRAFRMHVKRGQKSRSFGMLAHGHVAVYHIAHKHTHTQPNRACILCWVAANVCVCVARKVEGTRDLWGQNRHTQTQTNTRIHSRRDTDVLVTRRTDFNLPIGTNQLRWRFGCGGNNSLRSPCN